MIHPLLALIGWTFVVLVWLYAKRIPAMLRLGLDPQMFADKRNLAKLPADVRAISDNYANLLEQPVLFYALCLSIQISGQTDQFFVVLGWIYVWLRIAHTGVQAFGNRVMLRFFVFAAGTLVLAVMTLRAVRLVFNF